MMGVNIEDVVLEVSHLNRSFGKCKTETGYLFWPGRTSGVSFGANNHNYATDIVIFRLCLEMQMCIAGCLVVDIRVVYRPQLS